MRTLQLFWAVAATALGSISSRGTRAASRRFHFCSVVFSFSRFLTCPGDRYRYGSVSGIPFDLLRARLSCGRKGE